MGSGGWPRRPWPWVPLSLDSGHAGGLPRPPTGVSGGPRGAQAGVLGQLARDAHSPPARLLCVLREPLSRLSCSVPICAAEAPGVRWGEPRVVRRAREPSVSVQLAGSPVLARGGSGCPGPWVRSWYAGGSPTDQRLPACCRGFARARTPAHTRGLWEDAGSFSLVKPWPLAGVARGQGRLGGRGLPPGVLLLCANVDRLAPLFLRRHAWGPDPGGPHLPESPLRPPEPLRPPRTGPGDAGRPLRSVSAPPVPVRTENAVSSCLGLCIPLPGSCPSPSDAPSNGRNVEPSLRPTPPSRPPAVPSQTLSFPACARLHAALSRTVCFKLFLSSLSLLPSTLGVVP